MKEWTLINEFGDRIERFRSNTNYSNALKGKSISVFSYYGLLKKETGFDRTKSSGINQIKSIIQNHRGVKKCNWQEVWE